MNQNEQGAAAPKIAYCLSNLAPNEVQFLIDMVSSVHQPLVVTQPIYQKIVSQVHAQDKAREEARQQKEAGKAGGDNPKVTQAAAAPNLHKPIAARRGKIN